MLTPQLMALMDDHHLVAALRAEFDPLTSTPAEQELLKRIEKLLDEQKDDSPLEDSLVTACVERDELPAILKAMEEHYCSTASELRSKLERADKFYDIASEAGDVITRLNDLINTTL